jgi:hypothetical protein
MVVTGEARRIVSDIASSGLPCEIDVTSTLRDDGWMLFNQTTYVDDDTGKLRYVDVSAFKNEPVQIILVIECCKSKKPWTFYGSWKRSGLPTIPPSHSPSGAFKLRSLQSCSHQGKPEIFEATIPYEPFKEGKGRDVFDASMKVLKALRYDQHEHEEFERQYKFGPVPRVFYPVIVFDGHLFALLLRKGRIVPSRADYLRYDVGDKERHYLIDVVTRTSFKNYVKLIDEELLEWKKFGKSEGSFLEEKEQNLPSQR